jgi:hypothetical protein
MRFEGRPQGLEHRTIIPLSERVVAEGFAKKIMKNG